ncbi:acyl-CoA dehydrogenase family protein [Paraburkholderia rhynchosiae]|uniref:Acyl-[acyl-carrier-protein] dehydrogenase MbtN n=1 Tax=Paraburkholderia rhynchosiae TaxID=487049 RepID=A0A2N7W512_9BURK|nr:acyl-CoA dehydrogenase family protein [Paraburkholderia rhynchosiae]PMS24493.1 acyl-CoA dehydrogenase [Paraburkholderia rhynchosiae]CAB3736075.1 Acyl-CoA dehydrogenase [Paraburkholderia rhynchosiae]
MIERTLFSDEHEIFRESVRRFIETEISPFHAEWEHKGIVPRTIWEAAGRAGLLGCSIPEEYGGAGGDHLFDFVLVEELARAGITGPGFAVHNEMVMPYILAFGTDEQKRHWLPKMVRGEVIGALGLTEPHAGSDLKNIRTRAVRDGDFYVISGQKVFISNGQLCDVIVLATKTDPMANSNGISLFIVEASRDGFKRGRRLEKIGLKAQDTSELFFEDVRVPASNLLGPENGGFKLLMKNLAQERLTQAVRSAAVVEAVLEWTIDYVADREMFDQTLADFQNTQFKLADLKTEATIGRVFVDRCIEAFMSGKLDGTDAAMAKMWLSNLHGRAVDECLQFFGGWGYMWEYPIARAFADARITRIAGGSIEVMKHIIGRSLFSNKKKK